MSGSFYLSRATLRSLLSLNHPERIKQSRAQFCRYYSDLLKINDTELTQKRSPVVCGPS